MSLHKITAGSGYDYLTRQVAAMDSTEGRHAGLAYYTEKGGSLTSLDQFRDLQAFCAEGIRPFGDDGDVPSR